jgi:UDP-N-acetylmuramate dehydrogenase
MTSFAELTTFHVGGSINRWAEIWSVAELNDWVASRCENPVLVLGNGSNLLAADAPFVGSVLRYRADHIEVNPGSTDSVESVAEGVSLSAEAGANLDDLVQAGLAAGYAELAGLSGIPGTVGGAIVQNAGAFGIQFGDLVDWVEVQPLGHASAINPQSSDATGSEASHEIPRIQRSKLQPQMIAASDLPWGYRSSWFQQNRDLIILRVQLKSRPQSKFTTVQYQSLAEHLAVSVGQKLAAQSVRTAVLAMRQARNALYDPDDPSTFSAGSFFKNPIIRGQKLSAADLIESAGIRPGFGLDKQVHLASNNPLIIVNSGSGTAEQIVHLAEYIQARVFSAHHIGLQPEVQLIGTDFALADPTNHRDNWLLRGHKLN